MRVVCLQDLKAEMSEFPFTVILTAYFADPANNLTNQINFNIGREPVRGFHSAAL
jgi:hypothetical protein